MTRMILLRALTVALWLLAVPCLGWAVVRLFGLERGFPVVQLMAFTPYVAAAAVVVAAVALVTRRWGLVWASGLGCAYCVLDGVWAIWSRQTAHGAGPGIGLVLAVLAMAVLAVQWLKLALSRK